MPIGKLKNTLYGLAVPLIGKPCKWSQISVRNETHPETSCAVTAILKKYRAVGAAIQRFEKGQLTALYTAGNARLSPAVKVNENTLFRTASIAKTITALLVFRLQTRGLLDVREEVSDFLGYEVRNPHCPHAPISLAMLLNHSSSIIDSPAYYASFNRPGNLKQLLSDPQTFALSVPGTQFKYSNFAAGIIGCMLENRFSLSLEDLLQRELGSLGIEVTYDVTKTEPDRLADSWRILPQKQCFHARQRYESSTPITAPDPSGHYLLASGNVYLTSKALAQLTLLAWNGQDGFLSPHCISMMQTPSTSWPEPEVRMEHGMGLFRIDDSSICPRILWGHQGFAYGAVNGLFFDEAGNGFASLNSGVSEQRLGHLALLHKDLISLFWKGDKP